MNSVVILITHDSQPPNGSERYFRLEVDLPGVPLRGDHFHFTDLSSHDVIVSCIEWEIYPGGRVKPLIHLSQASSFQDPPFWFVNEPGAVERLLKAGWKEVNLPYTEP
jgi:hypothetical protein